MVPSEAATIALQALVVDGECLKCETLEGTRRLSILKDLVCTGF
jgi:hypothetical protein